MCNLWGGRGAALDHERPQLVLPPDRPTVSRVPPAVVAEIEERAGWACEMCGRPAGFVELHHRRARKAGGGRGRDLDVAVNLLRVHPGCHAWAHAHGIQSRDNGWIVSEWGPGPEDVPVVVDPGLPRC